MIADRFLFTGLARDVARGLDLDWVLKLYQPLLWPDLVFYFSVSPATSGKRVTATRMPNFYEAGQDVTDVDDPVESYQRFISRVIREYESLALIFNFITVDAEQSIGEQHRADPRAVSRGRAAAVVDVERRRGRRMAGARRERGGERASRADRRLIAVDGVDGVGRAGGGQSRARASTPGAPARAAASAAGTRPASSRIWRWPRRGRACRRRGRCCCSTRPTSRSACAGRSGRRSPRAARSSRALRRHGDRLRPRRRPEQPMADEPVPLRAAPREQHIVIATRSAHAAGAKDGFVGFACSREAGNSVRARQRLFKQTAANLSRSAKRRPSKRAR